MKTLKTVKGKEIKTDLELSKLVTDDEMTEMRLDNKPVFVFGNLESGFGMSKDADCKQYISDIKHGEIVGQIEKGRYAGYHMQKLIF